MRKDKADSEGKKPLSLETFGSHPNFSVGAEPCVGPFYIQLKPVRVHR